MPTLNQPLENARALLAEACQAMDGLAFLLKSHKGGGDLKSIWIYSLIVPIQDNLRQALDELQYAGGCDEKPAARS